LRGEKHALLTTEAIQVLRNSIHLGT
jgi:hypothetical protein